MNPQIYQTLPSCLFSSDTVLKENLMRHAPHWRARAQVRTLPHLYKLDNKLKEEGLSWENCIGVRRDRAGAMLGKKKGLKARVFQVSPHVNFTHCFIHRESLASRTLEPELKHVLDIAIKVVNYIKTRPLNINWLSQGNVLSRLRDEVCIFLMKKHGSQLTDHLTDPDCYQGWRICPLLLTCAKRLYQPWHT